MVTSTGMSCSGPACQGSTHMLSCACLLIKHLLRFADSEHCQQATLVNRYPQTCVPVKFQVTTFELANETYQPRHMLCCGTFSNYYYPANCLLTDPKKHQHATILLTPLRSCCLKYRLAMAPPLQLQQQQQAYQALLLLLLAALLSRSICPLPQLGWVY